MPVRVKEKHIDPSMASEAEVSQAIEDRVATLTGRFRSNIGDKITPESTIYTTVGNQFVWVNSRCSSYKNGTLVLYIKNVSATRFIEFRILNNATGEVLIYHKVLATDPSSFKVFSIASPTQDCLLEFQVRKETNNGVGGTIETAAFEFDFSIF